MFCIDFVDDSDTMIIDKKRFEEMTMPRCDIERLRKQLKIAIDILEVISTHTIIPDENTVEQVGMVYNWSSKALEQIGELDK